MASGVQVDRPTAAAAEGRFARWRGRRTARVVTWAARVAGLLTILSLLTPLLRRRLQPATWFGLPPEVPLVGSVVVATLGVGLMMLATGLRRRKRRAWQLAVVACVLLVVSHVVGRHALVPTVVVLAPARRAAADPPRVHSPARSRRAAGRGAGRRPDAPRRLRRRRAAAAGAAVAARGPAVDGRDPGAVGALAGRGQRARAVPGHVVRRPHRGPRPDVRHRRARARRLLPAALRGAPARADRRRRRAHPGAARAPRPRRLAGLLRAAARQGGGVLAVGQGRGAPSRRGRGGAGLGRPAR